MVAGRSSSGGRGLVVASEAVDTGAAFPRNLAGNAIYFEAGIARLVFILIGSARNTGTLFSHRLGGSPGQTVVPFGGW